jgi:hypothetical protein
MVGRWVSTDVDLGLVLGRELLTLPCGISADSALKSFASEVLPLGRANQLKMPGLLAWGLSSRSWRFHLETHAARELINCSFLRVLQMTLEVRRT